MMVASVEWTSLGRNSLLPGPHLVAAKLGPCRPLSTIAEVASGLYVREYVPSDSDGAVPYLRVDNVREFVPNLSKGDLVFVNADTVPSYDRVSVKTGDVVIPRTATLGRAFVVPPSLDGAVMSQHATRIRLRDNSDLRSPVVLAAYLNSNRGREAVLARASGTTRLELTHESLEGVPVPTVLTSQQDEAPDVQRLGELIDSMRGFARKARAACDELMSSLGLPMPRLRDGYRVFECDVEPAKFVESALPRYHEPEMNEALAALSSVCKVRALGGMATIRRGKGTSSREYVEEGIPYLRTSSLINGGIDLFPDHFGSEATYEKHGQHLGEDDVLLSIEGKIGLVAVLGPDERVLIKNHIEYIRLNPATDTPPGFLAAWLGASFAQAQIRQATVIQTTIPGIASASRDILVPTAPRDEVHRQSFADKRTEIAALMRRSVSARCELRDVLLRLKQSIEHALSPPTAA